MPGPEIVLDVPPVGPGVAIWGLEARHTWNGAVMLNDLTSFPRYKLDRISGLTALGDSEDVRELAVGRLGEVPRRSFRRGKTITYEGRIQAQTLEEMREAEAALRAAFADQLTERRMIVTPHPSYRTGSRYFRARSLALEIADEQGSPFNITRGFQRAFVLSIRSSDPRYYDSEEDVNSLVVPNTDDAVTMTCDNTGRTATDPIFTLTGGSGVTARPVRLATTAPLPAHTRSGNVLTLTAPVYTTPLAFDGVVANHGDRLLIKNEGGGAHLENGIYDVAIVPIAGQGYNPVWAYTFTRSSDSDVDAEMVHGINVSVGEGVTQAGLIYELSTADPITLNTTALTFGASSILVGVVLTNETLDKRLILPTLTLLGVEVAIINFRTRSILKQNAPVPGVLSPLSDWWDAGVEGFAAGDNVIRAESYVGDSIASTPFGVQVEARWHAAYS